MSTSSRHHSHPAGQSTHPLRYPETCHPRQLQMVCRDWSRSFWGLSRWGCLLRRAARRACPGCGTSLLQHPHPERKRGQEIWNSRRKKHCCKGIIVWRLLGKLLKICWKNSLNLCSIFHIAIITTVSMLFHYFLLNDNSVLSWNVHSSVVACIYIILIQRE